MAEMEEFGGLSMMITMKEVKYAKDGFVKRLYISSVTLIGPGRQSTGTTPVIQHGLNVWEKESLIQFVGGSDDTPLRMSPSFSSYESLPMVKDWPW